MKGTITSEWEIKEQDFHLKIEIPHDVVAKIIIPEQYGKVSITAKDLTTNQLKNIQIASGTFDMPAGKSEIIAK